jgi:23S rRNA pseudouridine1911/1915/1917 synthase
MKKPWPCKSNLSSVLNNECRPFSMPAKDETQILFVRPVDAGQRLDALIAHYLPDYSRSTVAALIRDAHVRVDQEIKKPSHRVKGGEQIWVHAPLQAEPRFDPQPIALDILYEDPDLIVINKPAGMVVHPAPGNHANTLVNALLHHCPQIGGVGAGPRPGIVHRLDKETSGTLVVAKNSRAHQHLSQQFQQRSIKKCYLALVLGSPATDKGTIELPIGRHPVDRKKMSVHSRRSRMAMTDWTVKQRLGDATLLTIHLKTGRTHQIRVHCAAIHHPIIGDPVYGSRRGENLAFGKDPGIGQMLAGIRRQMLHAWRIEFIHPASQQPVAFESPLPEDMLRLIEALGAHASSQLAVKAAP